MRVRLLFWSSFVITMLVASAPTFGQAYYQWGVVNEVTSGAASFDGDAGSWHQTWATATWLIPSSWVYCEGWGGANALVEGFYTAGYTVDVSGVSYGYLAPPSSTIWTRGGGDAAGTTPRHMTLVSARSSINISGSTGQDYNVDDPDSATYEEYGYFNHYGQEDSGVAVGHAVYAQATSTGYGSGEGSGYGDTDLWMY